MGVVRFLLYAPAMGKTYSSKKYVSSILTSEIGRYGSPKTKILWLTPLRSLRNRERYDLIHNFRTPAKYAHLLPSKEEAGCPLMRKNYSPILSLVLCLNCPSKNCWYHQLIKEYIESNEGGIWVGTHHFLPFSIYGHAKIVVVDEYDAMIPFNLITTIPADQVEKLIQMRLVDKEVLRKLHRKGMLYKWGDVYWIPMKVFFYHVSLYAKELILLSATPPPREFGFELTFFDPDQVPEDVVDSFDMNVRIEEKVVVPKTHKIEGCVLGENIYVRSAKREAVLNEIPRIVNRLGGKTTIIVASKRERERLRNILEKRLPNLKIATDSEYEYHKLSDADVRVIVVGGLVNRGWDIDSDNVIALWQYMPPNEKIKLLQFLTDYLDTSQENVLTYIEYRKHVQTLFRAVRSYSNPHTLILLDSNYYSALNSFRTTRFLTPSLRIVKSLDCLH